METKEEVFESRKMQAEKKREDGAGSGHLEGEQKSKKMGRRQHPRDRDTKPEAV